MSKLLALLCVALLVAVQAVDVKPASKEKADRMKAEAVKNLDLNRFQGLWYEIGSSGAIQKAFTKDCRCTSILFSLMEDNKSFNMLAKCMNASSGEVISARAKSVPFDHSLSSFSLVSAAVNASAAKKLQSPHRFEKEDSVRALEKEDEEEEGLERDTKKTPDYIILAVDENAKDYGWAVIAAPKLDSVWILSRKPSLTNDIYSKLVRLIEEKGFTGTHIRKTTQKGCPPVEVRKMKELAHKGGIEDALVYKKKKEGKFVPVGEEPKHIAREHEQREHPAQPLSSEKKQKSDISFYALPDDDEGIVDEGCGYC